jgi:hypothetical protein
MLNIVKKSIRPTCLQSLRGVAKKPPPTMTARHLSSLLPRRVSNMSLLPQMVHANQSEIILNTMYVLMSFLAFLIYSLSSMNLTEVFHRCWTLFSWDPMNWNHHSLSVTWLQLLFKFIWIYSDICMAPLFAFRFLRNKEWVPHWLRRSGLQEGRSQSRVGRRLPNHSSRALWKHSKDRERRY